VELPIRTVLVPTDLSPLGNAAVPIAFGLARCLGAKVVLAHVLEGEEPPNPLYAHSRPTPSPEQRRELEARARAELAALVPADRGSVPCEVEVRRGSVVEELCRLAAERDGPLIAIASHGRSGLGHLLLGSVAERVLRHAPCSVLVLR
jgi:nucleotide-binding universal stress UspA family protein